MEDIICPKCGGHYFTATVFGRNRFFNHGVRLLMGHKATDLICQRCQLVIWTIRAIPNITQEGWVKTQWEIKKWRYPSIGLLFTFVALFLMMPLCDISIPGIGCFPTLVIWPWSLIPIFFVGIIWAWVAWELCRWHRYVNLCYGGY